MPETQDSTTPGRTAARTLYIIDGYAQFFRAYHAIRTPMSSPVTKEPTNMTFGFIGMLLKLLRGEGTIAKDGGKADMVAVCLDVSGDRGTFRSQIYPEYKANRSAPPEDLEPQVDRCLETLKKIGVPLVGAEGFEADDCIATLVSTLQRTDPDVRIRIISKDKDLKQLLREGHVELFDIHTDLVISEESLKTEMGITPAQVIDMLSLMGDNVDNVPGVEGVGPKTAAKLIAEHGTLESVLKAAVAGKVKGKVGEKLAAVGAQENWGGLKLSHELVSLRHDVPVTLDLRAAEAKGLRLAELIPVLKELGFNRYQDEVRALLGEKLGEKVGAGGQGRTAEKGDTKGSGGRAKEMTLEDGTVVPVPARKIAAVGPSLESASIAEAKGKSKRGSTDAPTGFATLFDVAEGKGGAAGAAEAMELASRMAQVRAQSGTYACVRSEAELLAFIGEARAVLAENADAAVSIDTETTGLSPLLCELCGVSLSCRAGAGVYVPVRSPSAGSHMDESRVLGLLRGFIDDPGVRLCGHNLKFDSLVLRHAGLGMTGISDDVGNGSRAGRAAEETAKVPFDSMVASFLIDATRSSHSLDALSLALLGRTNISIKELIGDGGKGSEARTFASVPLEAATEYAAEDADAALQLREKMLPELRAMGLLPLFERLEMPLVGVLAELEYNGIRVDRAELERQRARLQTRIDALRKEIDTEAMERIGRKFNPDSPRQLASVLFNKPTEDYDPDDTINSGPGLGLKPVKKIKTGYSTDAEVLETLAQDPEIGTKIPGLIVEYRELTKLVNTYLVALVEAINPRTGRVHSSFNQTVAVTGRLASSDPNLQNIPIRTDVGKEIRRAFVAELAGNRSGVEMPAHVLISADYSQIELRLLAHLSRDPALIEAFNVGEDIHTTVAAQIAGISPKDVTKQQRSAAKMVNFGIVYGVTAFGLARRLGAGTSNAQAAEIIDGYKKRFAGITTFLQECIEHAQRHGYVQTMLGRRRTIPEIESTNPSKRSLAERTAINTVVQGSAADLIKLAMVDIHREILERRASAKGTTLKMLLQIHDELVFECAADEAEESKRLIVERMENAAGTWRMPDGSALKLAVPIRVDASVASNWFDGK